MESESCMNANTANAAAQVVSPIVQTPSDIFRMKRILLSSAVLVCLVAVFCSAQSSPASPRHVRDGKQLFESETFAGNGRTCRTCHSQSTGTVSPQDAQKRFRKDPNDPLFLGDGSDDGLGHGVTRMLKDAPAPYFHDNSAKTLEDVAAHYAKFFFASSGGRIVLTPQDQQDIVAFMKLLD